MVPPDAIRSTASLKFRNCTDAVLEQAYRSDRSATFRVQRRPGSITELHEDDYFHNRQIVRLSDTGHLTN